jgi:hypothetical protein
MSIKWILYPMFYIPPLISCIFNNEITIYFVNNGRLSLHIISPPFCGSIHFRAGLILKLNRLAILPCYSKLSGFYVFHAYNLIYVTIRDLILIRRLNFVNTHYALIIYRNCEQWFPIVLRSIQIWQYYWFTVVLNSQIQGVRNQYV